MKIQRERMKENDRIWLAWLVSVTYCDITAIFLFENINYKTVTPRQLESFWRTHKSALQFNSARRYAKNMNWAVPLLSSFIQFTRREPLAWLTKLSGGTALENYSRILRKVEKVPFTGRFAGDLFLEMLLWMSRRKTLPVKLEEPLNLNWKKGSNLTSGMLNLLYRDEEADKFDRSGTLTPEAVALLNQEIWRVQNAVKRTYPQQENALPLITPKLCSFRNLFKGTRYGGYHHDRQLENLRNYEQLYPREDLWKRLYQIRREIFSRNLLGEFGGWNGIRKERKKLWLTTGQTGVEEI